MTLALVLLLATSTFCQTTDVPITDAMIDYRGAIYATERPARRRAVER